MNVKLLLFACLFLALGCISTELKRQIDQSNQRALEVNGTRDELIVIYRTEGNRVIDQAAARDEAEQSLERVRVRWRPVWGTCNDEAAGPDLRCHDGAWPALRDAQHAWATLLEQQRDGATPDAVLVQRTSATLRQAYCSLGSSLPQGVAVPSKIQAACESR